MDNITIATMATIFTLVPIVLVFVAANSRGEENQLVTVMIKSKFFLYVGFLGLMMFPPSVIIGLQVINENTGAAVIAIIGGTYFLLAGLYLIFDRVNWRLIFENEVLIHKNWLGIKRTYKYSEITKIYADYVKQQKTPEKYVVYLSKRKIVVDCFVINFGSFERTIKKRLKNAKNPIRIEARHKRI